MSLTEALKSKEIGAVEAFLDGTDHAGRLRALERLTSREQAQLYEMSDGRGCTLGGNYVAHDAEPLNEVIHWGYNSLPTFRVFQKRFCRPSQARDPAVLFGYNEQSMKVFTGPGYFVAREDTHESGVSTVVIDYKAEADERPKTWPVILPNAARLSRWIYFGTRDWMWTVSRHVTVGRAQRDTGWMDNWFVLCREL